MNFLIYLSKYQLGPSLRLLGSTPEEINVAKENNSSYIGPYYCIDNRETCLLKKEREDFKIFTNKSVNRKKFESDQEYIKYINFIRKDLESCPNCHVECCSFCRKNNVVHSKHQCELVLWKRVKDARRSWRTYIKNDTIQMHESALLRSYYNTIENELYGKDCPCQAIYDNYYHSGSRFKNENEAIIDNLKRVFDSDLLLKHVKLINQIKILKLFSSY